LTKGNLNNKIENENHYQVNNEFYFFRPVRGGMSFISLYYRNVTKCVVGLEEKEEGGKLIVSQDNN
jgi:hypothetical protein